MKKLLIFLISLLLMYWEATLIVPANIESGKSPVKNLVGIAHVALGSDYDGSIPVLLGIPGFPLIVESLPLEKINNIEIRAIMGENVKRFLINIL